jgi:glycosyltransferase involved in cell wall biosynthesis
MKAPVSRRLISVVTPFRNTALYLKQCIESVLAQSYPEFEYILSDNCSTDGSIDIAESYARRDSRIRLIRQAQPLSQVQHYNAALAEISATSQYCKLVQADDCIFTDCLRLMVQAFKQSETIGLVSSYDLKGTVVRGSGYPADKSFLTGREAARLYLLGHLCFFGSPTTVMYRSSLVRNGPFYQEFLLHEDTEKCMEILKDWNFGFVYQVLSFLRADNESISSVMRYFQPDSLDRYIIGQRYADVFLDAREAAMLKREYKEKYYSLLAKEVVRFRGSAFWSYHKDGLKTLGETLDLPALTTHTLRELMWMAVNPGATARLVLREAKSASKS